jgi:hypothetical protein
MMAKKDAGAGTTDKKGSKALGVYGFGREERG